MSDVWAPFEYFVGKWTGESSGSYTGTGAQEREYAFILRGRFLQSQARCVFPPTEKNPAGEVHEDVNLISFDRQRNCFVWRSFHVEGFVNHYVGEVEPGKTYIFTSESVENGPTGLRARETIRIVSDDEFVEEFELAFPGKEFQLYTRTCLRRVK